MSIAAIRYVLRRRRTTSAKSFRRGAFFSLAPPASQDTLNQPQFISLVELHSENHNEGRPIITRSIQLRHHCRALVASAEVLPQWTTRTLLPQSAMQSHDSRVRSPRYTSFECLALSKRLCERDQRHSSKSWMSWVVVHPIFRIFDRNLGQLRRA